LLVPTTWNQDDHKPGYFALTLPPHLAAGRYGLQVSLYDANTLDPTLSTEIGDSSPANPPAAEPRTIAELHVGDTMQLLPAPSNRSLR
jgi:hypothetical protein